MSETTSTRRWRFGAPWECELDSLADRLIHDADLRSIVVGREVGDPADVTTKRKLASAAEWMERIRKLAISQRLAYAEQLRLVLERAIEFGAD